MTDLEDDPFLSVAKVAKMFDVTPYTVREWLRDGNMKGTKINNFWKVRKSETVRYANVKYGESE